MIRINLLPHREEKRKARQQQMLFISGGVAALGALSVLFVYLAIATMISEQAGNNQYLKGEITKLNTEIEEIKALKDKTRSLLERKKVVEDLQANRAEAVHLFDQLVRLLPEGIYLKAVKQNGKVVNIQGYAQSNARVSTLMRNLEASPWLELPDLVEIKGVTVNSVRANEFSLNVKISEPHKAEPTVLKDKKS